ncbi:arylsulfatase [Neohortaea acidophila]|uniref:Arylsulfatase n=1 Tax=Neohortaea acidophila TaxID=245834 RepID=A0A6A6PKJ7_9PEZI|nr:arylsulfatase [Neohortaea acidophila]KAF2480539.1 arylsulfatase [Neohortaea acidophila]
MPDKRPNCLIIVADDLGFTDISCYGSEIPTPNIDSLAYDAGGLRFTSFHVAAACSPTRAMLMTGTDHHLTGLGQLSEFVRNSPAHQGRPGHEGYLTDKVVALPELLRDAGYHTVMAGKWHLGLKPEYSPKARGFERSFALLPGCANHYAYEPPYDNPKEPPRFFETAVTALHMEDLEYIPTVPKDFYSSDYYATKLLQYLHNRTPEEKEKPLFAYLPFSAPHWPLQAPKESMDQFKGQYADGPEALRLRRLESLKALGMVEPHVVPHPIVTGPNEPAEWSEMTELERAKSARSMEVYAGMVKRMDENIGLVLAYLRDTGEYDNTHIFFMSDNGAEGASYEARDAIREDVLNHINKYYDNSLENIGRHDSFVWYGARWAQAATAPSRLYKLFSTQGGVRVPLVLKPARVQDSAHPTARNTISPAFCTVMDILPTLLDYASIPHPQTYKGKPVASPRGTSWKTFLDTHLSTQQSTSPWSIHPETHATGFEVSGSGALRRGKYKITYVPLPHGPQKWELFDVLADPGETRDLRDELPGVFEEMLAEWEVYKKDVGVVGLRGEDWGSWDGVRDEFEDTGKWIRFLGRDGEGRVH